MNPICRLCIVTPETWQHFISECVFLNLERSDYIEKLLKNPDLQYILSPQVHLHTSEILTQLALDASAVLEKEQFDKDIWGCLNFRLENIYIKSTIKDFQS